MGHFTRLTFNSNHWQNPSGPDGKCPGSPGSPLWECSAGFGFEEWYRSENFRRTENGEDWQYGYWQCFKNPMKKRDRTYENVDVYTRHCDGGCAGTNTGNTLLVAHYNQITVLSIEERIEAVNQFAAALRDIRGQLLEFDVNVQERFDNEPNKHPKLNIKFRISDETYVFDGVRPFTPKRHGYRFGLYLRQ